MGFHLEPRDLWRKFDSSPQKDHLKPVEKDTRAPLPPTPALSGETLAPPQQQLMGDIPPALSLQRTQRKQPQTHEECLTLS